MIDSLNDDHSTIVVKGTDVCQNNAGDWMVIDDAVYQIATIKPQTDRTTLTLTSPLEAFSRTLEYGAPVNGLTSGEWLACQLTEHWIQCSDENYALPYLHVSNLSTIDYIEPELDSSGCYVLADYARLLRRGYHVNMRFAVNRDILDCTIVDEVPSHCTIVFDDGRNQLTSLDYSSSGTAKLTVLCDVDTGTTDANGEKILERHRSIWYLSESGSVSQSPPARRAIGTWDTICVSKLEDVERKVIETFAKNKTSHKLEFYSSQNLRVQDACTFLIHDTMVVSSIVYKRKNSTDARFFYRCGELATTATEKLKGLIK